MSRVPVHGGLDAPVRRTLTWAARKSLVDECNGLPTIQVADADLATVRRLGDGTLSPLTGFMDRATWDRVLDERVVVRDGERYAWTIPFALPVTDAEAATLAVGRRAVLRASDGSLVGAIEVASLFPWDKDRMVRSVYGTERHDHPGGAAVMGDPRDILVGGAVWAAPAPVIPGYGHLVVSPAMTRALIDDRGWERTVAFQTRNPLHRAHEYALVHAVEELTRSGHYVGALLHPLVGQLKGDDVDAPTRMLTYQALHAQRLLGRGDTDDALWERVGYTLQDVFELRALDIKMFYGGPAEAIMHGIYRQNHGCSHIVIGRSHADAPASDGTALWGDFEAHDLFDDPPGHLAIEAVKVGHAAWFDRLGRVDLVERHPDEEGQAIGGSMVRRMLARGELPPASVMRPETAKILLAATHPRITPPADAP